MSSTSSSSTFSEPILSDRGRPLADGIAVPDFLGGIGGAGGGTAGGGPTWFDEVVGDLASSGSDEGGVADDMDPMY